MVQKIYEWSSCPFAKMIPSWESHFGKSAKNNQEWDDYSILFDAKLSLMLDGGQYLKKEKAKY